MGYFDWHGAPGYFRDITRHFPSSTRLLDLGCGAAWLGEHYEDYTGLDASGDAVEAAAERGITVIQGSVEERLPFEDATFDGVIAKDLLEHVERPGEVVREINRVLRPGGRVFASSPDAQKWVWDDYTHVRPFTRKGFRRLFTDHGLKPVTVGYESVMPGTSVIAARLPSHRRPLPLRVAAWLPVVRRNVWILAERG
ncbi:class I SAM-dependent methyltransferase [Pseudonocardia kujensis]|uniref:class I SAM-dependent methyltransferase n=1 Tax=Pseudonocardia kujensis TaxID=1128675 RepID=UPI001E323ABD|nr:class I SAM-dependent methyltransferase [Pseudonocardia kujensis]MCE0761784.1 class I SAM-dependent methyltransferase [Pseudonocardia kujensis]